MTLGSHQIKAANKIVKKVKKHGLALLSGEPRSGKTLSFLKAARDLKAKNILIITQKAAMADIAIQAMALGVAVTIVNYHKAKTQKAEFDLMILDECHRWITGYPKRSTIWGEIRPLTVGVPIIYSSGTMTPEGYAGLFNMLALSDRSPWRKYKTFMHWHFKYGTPYSMQINSFSVTKYDRTKESKVLRDVKKLTVTITRKEAGHKHEPVDNPVYISLGKKQQKFEDKLEEDQIILKHDIVADTPASMLQKCHQIAGGFVKTEDDGLYTFKSNPKMDWLHANIDPENTMILAHHIAEQKALAALFPNTGSITKNAEGKDFSHIDTLVIYSMSFSAATYEQVRVRQANISRNKPITIIYLLAGIDKYVYKAVHSKKNFTASWYRRNK